MVLSYGPHVYLENILITSYLERLPSKLSRTLVLDVNTWSHSSSKGLFAKSSYFSTRYGHSIRLPSYPTPEDLRS
jgi:hypothetical protein